MRGLLWNLGPSQVAGVLYFNVILLRQGEQRMRQIWLREEAQARLRSSDEVQVLDLLEDACEGLLQHIREHDLNTAPVA